MPGRTRRANRATPTTNGDCATLCVKSLEDVIRKHDCGGVVFVASRESSSWRFVLPMWGGIVIEGVGLMRVRISTRTPALRAVAESTLHYVADMRDLLGQSALMFMDMFEQVESEMKKQGAEIEHSQALMGRRKRDDMD